MVLVHLVLHERRKGASLGIDHPTGWEYHPQLNLRQGPFGENRADRSAFEFWPEQPLGYDR